MFKIKVVIDTKHALLKYCLLTHSETVTFCPFASAKTRTSHLNKTFTCVCQIKIKRFVFELE